MRLSEIMSVRRLAAVGILSSAVWCGQAHAQVLDQVPSDAMVVFKIKDLAKTNAKVAKLAHTLGLDELSPDMKDPLGAVLEKAKMTKGLDKEGDAALAIYPPDENKGEEPEPVALVPVSDYDAFVGNFTKEEKSDAGAGLTAVKDPDGGKTLYIGHRGKYAIISDKQAHLSAKGGIKLSNVAAKEADSKDAVFILNMPVLREHALPQIKEHRKELVDGMDKELANQDQLKPFIPVFDAIVNHAIDTADEFLTEADAVVFSMNITDGGISGGALVEFKEQSKLGTTVAGLKAGSTPLLAGLPQAKYFVFGGASIDSKATGAIAAEWLDPVAKSLTDTHTDAGKKIAGAINDLKVLASSSNHSVAGMIAPTKPMGQESLIQEIGIVYGDAKAINKSEKSLLGDMNDLMALAPQNKGMTTKVVFGDAKTIDGVELTSYATKLDFDKNDPQGAQAEQVLGMIYGPNGNSGVFGVIDDKSFIVAQGTSDEVIKEAIASAKAGKDILSDTPGVKAVNALLPANPSAAYYIALDNIITTSLRYAQGFGLQVKFKLPQDLPPVGMSLGVDGSSIRFDGVMPTETIKALVTAGLQAYTDFQQGAKGGL